jgi:adenine-specific DNA-methyltransferase
VAKVFDYPKPIALLSDVLQATTSDTDIVLDFFSGSGTTAHTIMKLNSEDNMKRRFILVQLPEQTAENSDAYKNSKNKESSKLFFHFMCISFFTF